MKLKVKNKKPTDREIETIQTKQKDVTEKSKLCHDFYYVFYVRNSDIIYFFQWRLQKPLITQDILIGE